MLMPDAERSCDAVVTLTQADFDSATDDSAQKGVSVAVSATVKNKPGLAAVTAIDDDSISLSIVPNVNITVVSTPATILPTSGEPQQASLQQQLSHATCESSQLVMWQRCYCPPQVNVSNTQIQGICAQ
jgi:hypothetical protein